MTYCLDQYINDVEATDRFPKSEIQLLTFGLFGEVGSVMSVIKKHSRDNKAYARFRQSIIEELGDVFWYFTALTRRFDMRVQAVFKKIELTEKAVELPVDDPSTASSLVAFRSKDCAEIYTRNLALTRLGVSCGDLLRIEAMSNHERFEALKAFAHDYFVVLSECGIKFSEVLRKNVAKTISCFGAIDLTTLPDFDKHFDEREQIPRAFEIEIFERKDGKVYTRWKEAFVGDPLTDSIAVDDGFRYHDVIHLAHAAILHWSPTFRGLIKRKRKSEPRIDECQDGGRAGVCPKFLG